MRLQRHPLETMQREWNQHPNAALKLSQFLTAARLLTLAR